MSDEIKRAIVAGLHQFAWPHLRLDEATHLVLSYCYRDLPFAVAIPAGRDGRPSSIGCIWCSPSVGLVFMLANSSEIFVLTEDLILLGSVLVPAIVGGGKPDGEVAFDPTTNTMHVPTTIPSCRVISFGLDGRTKPSSLEAHGMVHGIHADRKGTVCTLESDDYDGNWKLVCGKHELKLPAMSRYAWGTIGDDDDDDGLYFSYAAHRYAHWTTIVCDSNLCDSPRLPTSGAPLSYHTASRTIIVERGENWALEAIDLHGNLKFRCPTFFTGDKASLRSVVNMSWGSVIIIIDGNQITLSQLTFEPIPPLVSLS